jgi:hypothetical protein
MYVCMCLWVLRGFQESLQNDENLVSIVSRFREGEEQQQQNKKKGRGVLRAGGVAMRACIGRVRVGRSGSCT